MGAPFTPMRLEWETERLWLRPQRASDGEVVHELWTERDVRALRRIDAEGHPTVEEMRAYLAQQWEANAESGIALLMVERKEDGVVVGYCGLTAGQSDTAEPEIAYELLRRWHGHGYATEAARAVLIAAEETGRARLWATVREWNHPSFRVLEKLDFTNSGKVTPDPERGDSIWMTRELGESSP